MTNREKIIEWFNNKIGTPVVRAELDIVNVASFENGGRVSVTSEAISNSKDFINDGWRAHLNLYNENSYWETGSSAPQTVTIKFKGKKKINKVAIWFFPKNTRVNVPAHITIPTSYIIEYAAGMNLGELSDWTAWSGLEDRSEEVGQEPTVINNGVVSNNNNTYNVFVDLEGVEAYGIRIRDIQGAWTRICEIEVWQTIEFKEFSRIRINTSRDFKSGEAKASLGSGTIIADINEYQPGYGIFKNVTKNDINKMALRIYGGLSNNGYAIYDIMGHYTIYDWTIYAATKIIEFKIKDRVKDLKESEIIMGPDILKDKTREYLIELLGLKANISSDEMELFESVDFVQVFYPTQAKIWDEMYELARGLVDIDFYLTKENKLRWGVYLESIPHEIITTFQSEFEQGILSNISTLIKPDSIVLPQVILDNSKEQFQSGEKIYKVSIGDDSKIRLSKTAELSITSYQNKSYASPDPITETTGSPSNIYDKNTTTGYGVRKRQNFFSLGVPNSVTAGNWIRLNFNKNQYIKEVYILGRGIMGGNSYKKVNIRLHKPNGTYEDIYTRDWSGGSYWLTADFTAVKQNINLIGNYIEIEFTAQAIDVTVGDSTADATAIIYEVTIVYESLYETSGEFISREIDTRCLSEAFNWDKSYFVTYQPSGTSISVEIASYDTSGTLWSNIPSGQKQSITSGSIPSIPAKRYIKYRLVFTSDGTIYTPYFSYYQQIFPLTGKFTSAKRDMLAAPKEWGGFDAIDTKPAGTSVTYFTQTSDDGIVWEEEKQVVNGVISSSLKRFIRAGAYLSSNSNNLTPEVSEIRVIYYTGSDAVRYNTVNFLLDENDTNEIPLTFSDEVEGERVQADKVEVVVKPYYLFSSEKIWEGDVDWLARQGRTYTYTPQLTDPAEIDSDYKLKINGNYYGEGETIIGNLKVEFTRHPINPVINITPLVDLLITEFYIEAKQWKQSSQMIFARGGGNKIERYENKYLTSSAMGEAIANFIYPQLKNIIGRVGRDMPIRWCPALDFNSVIRVLVSYGKTYYYTFYECEHIFNALSEQPTFETRLKCKEIDFSIFEDPGYWGERRFAKPLYWGTGLYFGGRLYG